MPIYHSPFDQYQLLLSKVFPIEAALSDLPGLEEFDLDLLLGILEQAGRLAEEVLQPINLSGDAAGSELVDGVVRTPKGFREAYRTYAEGGWCGISADPDYGGQGLPYFMQTAVDEMVSGANLSFGLFPGLSRGASEAIHAHASDELKHLYLPKLASGEWTGIMALTESSAGSDLGLLKTRAKPNGDGSFALTGTKIFISSGDHDFGGNIVHLVLARLPDAPDGVKGISLFLVPKFLLTPDGTAGDRNSLSVGSLEHKMGIHAQPTCVMNYDGATGWLVGDANRGLNAMFVMMNAERLMVGMQGLGIAEVANQRRADDGTGQQKKGQHMRGLVADRMNDWMAQHGIDARVDHRKAIARGDDTPAEKNVSKRSWEAHKRRPDSAAAAPAREVLAARQMRRHLRQAKAAAVHYEAAARVIGRELDSRRPGLRAPGRKPGFSWDSKWSPKIEGYIAGVEIHDRFAAIDLTWGGQIKDYGSRMIVTGKADWRAAMALADHAARRGLTSVEITGSDPKFRAALAAQLAARGIAVTNERKPSQHAIEQARDLTARAMAPQPVPKQEPVRAEPPKVKPRQPEPEPSGPKMAPALVPPWARNPGWTASKNNNQGGRSS